MVILRALGNRTGCVSVLQTCRVILFEIGLLNENNLVPNFKKRFIFLLIEVISGRIPKCWSHVEIPRAEVPEFIPILLLTISQIFQVTGYTGLHLLEILAKQYFSYFNLDFRFSFFVASQTTTVVINTQSS